MRVLLRLLAPLVGLAVAAAGVLVVIEVVAAWVRTPAVAGLIVPWPDWRATLSDLTWAQPPVPVIAIAVAVVGLVFVLVGLLARRSAVGLDGPGDDMTVTTTPRVLARLVGTRVREAEDVAAASVTASARRVAVAVEAWDDEPEGLRESVAARVGELLDELPLRRRPRVAVSVAEKKGPAVTVDLTKHTPPSATLRRRSRSAVARSVGGDRGLLVVLGLVLLAAGVLVALLGHGVFGAGRAARPLLDPIVVDALRAQPLLWRGVAIAAGVVLALLGLTWAARSVRPERRPDVRIDGGPGTSIVVSSSAAADAVATQAAGIRGVSRARARLVGAESAPAMRVTLWLADDADVRTVLLELHDGVLGTARAALDLPALPVAVRLELDRPQRHPRVA